ncbi:hypothetical protein PSTG_18402, partial [Puccinia striiformis f. sp. tritici PST-78]
MDDLKAVADYWRKVKSGELPATGPNEIGITIWTAEAAIKRITELERANKAQDDHINQQQDRIDSLEKTNSDLGQALGVSEKRLATPVRLPPLMDGELCGKYGAKYGAAANAHNNAITACSIAICGAGFKSEVTAP